MLPSNNFKDITGQRFGRLTVVSRSDNKVYDTGKVHTRWNCVCDCGNSVTVMRPNLYGKTVSCGCRRIEALQESRGLRTSFDCIDCGTNLSSTKKKVSGKTVYAVYMSGGHCGNRCISCYNVNKRISNYGLTRDEYIRMVRQQNGLCFICVDASCTEIDHNHESGAVRALLCSGCNSSVGFMKENPDNFRSAALYLEKYQ